MRALDPFDITAICLTFSRLKAVFSEWDKKTEVKIPKFKLKHLLTSTSLRGRTDDFKKNYHGTIIALVSSWLVRSSRWW